jgi:hypothetical protein
LADADIESLQGSLCRLHAADEGQRDLDSLHRGQEGLRFVESAHALVGIVSDEAYCQKVSSSSLDTIDFNEIVSLADPYLSLFSRNIDTIETRHAPSTRDFKRSHNRYSPISCVCPRSKIPYSTTTANNLEGGYCWS